jgi:hypothetical protein
MDLPRIRKPSPAMAVALAALIVALGGTALAASKLVSGDSLIKKASLSGNRLRRHTVTGTQIKVSSLPKVPSAVNADSATHAVSAGTATTANGLPALQWVPLTLINSWANGATPGLRIPAVAVDAQGIVHFRGEIYCTSKPCLLTFAILPTGLSPSFDVILAAPNGGNATGRVIVRTASEGGGIESADDPDHAGSAQTVTALDGLTYPLG